MDEGTGDEQPSSEEHSMATMISLSFTRGLRILMAASAVAALAACQPTSSGSSGTQTLQVVDSQTGTITAVADVPVPASTMNQAGGALAGAVVGGLLGSQVGQGTGNTVATTVGALGGAAAGAAAARSVNGGTIPQWTVALDNGRSVAVQSNTAGLRVGSRVRVQQLSNGELRIGAI
jgi:outer membrane lipoprotein SlyB